VAIALAAAGVAAAIHWAGAARPPAPAPAVAPLDAGGKTRGRTDAPVLIEVYSDFLCSHCADFAVDVEPAIVREFVEPGVARLVYRHFPVVAPESTFLAALAECAADERRFWGFHDAVMRRVARRALRGLADVEAAAQEAGLDFGRLRACEPTPAIRARVDADHQAGERRGVQGTPTIFINDRRIVGNVPIAVIREAVGAAQAR
ncbi:MAG: thioredoxin domain-containing protein, partial [Armatimonadota bacterium]|nr:thioredoxin domain-containing protein [Armatimonadota bacterium]